MEQTWREQGFLFGMCDRLLRVNRNVKVEWTAGEFKIINGNDYCRKVGQLGADLTVADFQSLAEAIVEVGSKGRE